MADRDDSQLGSITRLAEHGEQECARKLSETRGRLNDRLARIEQLRTYQAEYAAQGRAEHGVSVHVSQLIGRAAFLGRLEDAIAHELAQKEMLEKDVQLCLQNWHEAHARAEAMRTLKDKQARAVERRHARREQSLADTHASSRHGLQD